MGGRVEGGAVPNKDLVTLFYNACVKAACILCVLPHMVRSFKPYTSTLEVIKDWRRLRPENEAREAASWCLPSVVE